MVQIRQLHYCCDQLFPNRAFWVIGASRKTHHLVRAAQKKTKKMRKMRKGKKGK